jgi:hypothetical protein
VCLFLGFQGQLKKFAKFAHLLFVVESFLCFPLVKLIDEALVARLV